MEKKTADLTGIMAQAAAGMPVAQDPLPQIVANAMAIDPEAGRRLAAIFEIPPPNGP